MVPSIDRVASTGRLGGTISRAGGAEKTFFPVFGKTPQRDPKRPGMAATPLGLDPGEIPNCSDRLACHLLDQLGPFSRIAMLDVELSQAHCAGPTSPGPRFSSSFAPTSAIYLRARNAGQRRLGGTASNGIGCRFLVCWARRRPDLSLFLDRSIARLRPRAPSAGRADAFAPSRNQVSCHPLRAHRQDGAEWETATAIEKALNPRRLDMGCSSFQHSGEAPASRGVALWIDAGAGRPLFLGRQSFQLRIPGKEGCGAGLALGFWPSAA